MQRTRSKHAQHARLENVGVADIRHPLFAIAAARVECGEKLLKAHQGEQSVSSAVLQQKAVSVHGVSRLLGEGE